LVIVIAAVPPADAFKLHDAGLPVAFERVAVAVECDRRTNKLQGLGCCRGLLQRDQRLHVGVHVDLLLDRRELDQLLSELIGIEWTEWILILQLCS